MFEIAGNAGSTNTSGKISLGSLEAWALMTAALRMLAFCCFFAVYSLPLILLSTAHSMTSICLVRKGGGVLLATVLWKGVATRKCVNIDRYKLDGRRG